jgi:multiple sugar transport system ATP-binding protein
MTVRENLAFGLENIKTPKAEIEQRVAEAARMLQIEQFLERRPKQLSGGQRQRVAIGRAVVREPRVFLFDEPLSNLDAELRVAMRAELTALHRRLGNTMIYVTHDQIEAMTMADKIVVLRLGVLEQAGRPLDLYNTPANRFVAGFIGSPRMNFIETTVTGIDADGVTVRDEEGFDYTVAVSGDGLSVGDAASLGIRPEHLEVDSRTDGDGRPLTVEATEQLGGESYLYCTTDRGQKLTVHFAGQTSITRGERVRALFRPEFLHLFSAETEAAQPRLKIGEAV